jgi:hypothetical protein
MHTSQISPGLLSRLQIYKMNKCLHMHIRDVRHLQCNDGGCYEIDRFNISYHCDDCGGDFIDKSKPARCTCCHQTLTLAEKAPKRDMKTKQLKLLEQLNKRRHKGTMGQIENIKKLKQALQRVNGRVWFEIYQKEATEIAKKKRRANAEKYEKRKRTEHEMQYRIWDKQNPNATPKQKSFWIYLEPTIYDFSQIIMYWCTNPACKNDLKDVFHPTFGD